MKFYKTLTCIAITTALAACGSSDSKKDDDPITKPPAPVETVVQGKAIKGLLTNAVVSVFKYVDGVAVALTDSELKDAAITTDATGTYTITLLDYQGPVKVEISPSTDTSKPTMMLCDAPAGCNGVAFGEEINLTETVPDFSLSAISVVNEGAEPVKVNVSAVTHLATQLVESKATVDVETVTQTLSEVGNTLGIAGDINTLEPTNTNDAAAVAGEDNDAELHYGLINAGIAQALFSDTSEGTLTEKLAEAAADLVENDGSFLATADGDDSSFELSLSQILEGAADVTQELLEDPALAENTELLEDLNEQSVNLEHEILVKTENVGDDGRIEPVADSTTDGSVIDKGRALVDDIRVFANLFDLTKVSGQAVETKGYEFVELTRAASDMVSAEAESITLLGDLSMAVAEISMAHELDPTKTSYALEEYLPAESSATGVVTYNMATHSYSADVVDGTTTAKLSLSAAVEEGDKSIRVSIAGTVASAAATLTLAETSGVSIGFGQSISLDMLQDEEFELEPVSGSLDIDVELAQKATDTVTNPITYAGAISAKLLTLITPTAFDYNSGESRRVHMSTEVILLPEMFSLSGSVSDSVSDGISIMLTVAAPELASHQAAGFDIDGVSLKDHVTISVSEDGNTVTTVVKDAYTETLTYAAGESAGEWQFTSTRVPFADGEETTVYNEYFTITDGPLGKEYLLASYGFGWADNYVMEPVDANDDGEADYYTTDYLGNNYHSENSTQADMLDDDYRLINNDGSLASVGNVGYHAEKDFDRIFHEWRFISLDKIDSAAKLMDGLLTFHSPQIEGIGTIRIEPTGTLDTLANGETRSLNAYVVEPHYAEAAVVAVSNSGNDVTLSFKGQETHHWNFAGTAEQPGNFKLTQTSSNGWENFTVVSTTVSVGLDIEKLTTTYDDGYYKNERIMTPVDDNADGKADYLDVCDIHTYQNDSSDEVTSVEGTQESNVQENCYINDLNALNNETYFGPLMLNPTSVDSAVDAWQAVANRGWPVGTWIDDLGYLAIDLDEADFEQIEALATTDASYTYDAKLQELDASDGLESDDNYIDATAKLTVNVTLGDYDIEVDVAASRAAKDAADAVVTATYQVPGEDAQRSFAINFDSENDNQITVTNEEGATITLTEPAADDTSAQIELGVITIGDEEVAKIVKRDSIILVVYSDGSVKSL